MKIVYHYEVMYLDNIGRKHLRFCENVDNVKELRRKYQVLEVNASKMIIDKKENF